MKYLWLASVMDFDGLVGFPIPLGLFQSAEEAARAIEKTFSVEIEWDVPGAWLGHATNGKRYGIQLVAVNSIVDPKAHV